VGFEKLEHPQEDGLGSHLRPDYGADLLDHFLPRLDVKRPKAEIVQGQLPVPTGGGFRIIGLQINLVWPLSQLSTT
jgi:hypothetical protein